MIDYENIHRANVNNIPADTHIWLFIGANQIAPSIEQFDFLFQHFGAERVNIIKVYWAAPNALDFCLSYHLGKIIQSDKEAQVWILSRDQGFNVLVKQVCMEEKYNKVATAINLADAIEKINAFHQPQNAPSDTPPVAETAIQAAESTENPEEEQNNKVVVHLSSEQLNRQYMARTFGLLREAAKKNVLTFKRREILETNLARHFKQKIWQNAPEIVCEDADLQQYIHQAINRSIERGFIVENDNGTLTYLFGDDDFVAHAQRHYFANPDILPKKTHAALSQLKTIANMWNCTPLEETAQNWLQKFQEKQLLWVCGQSVSYVSENEARDMELKARFLSRLNSEMGVKFSPNTQSALKKGIREKAAEALVSLSEQEIYKIVANLINSKRVFVNGDDLMWASRPAPSNHYNNNGNAPKKNFYNKKNQDPARESWDRVLHMMKSPNRPSSLIALRAHLINSLSSLNQTESDIDRWVRKLVDEGYVFIEAESGRVIYR